MRILVCTSELPYRPITGTRLVLNQVLRHLGSEHEITLVGYHWPEQIPDALPANVRVVSLPAPTRSRPMRAVGWIDGFRTGLPVQSVGLASPLLQALKGVLLEETFDVAHVTASAIAEVGAALADVPKVLVSLDAWNLNAQSQTAASPPHLRPIRRLEELRIKHFVRSTFPMYDSVVTVADEDANELKRLGANDRVVVIPNGVDSAEFHPGTEASEPELLVFVGTMRWAPNITAARFLCHNILPIVQERHPSAHVAIVGRAAPPELREELERVPGVSVVGEVPDVGDWIRRAAVFCCPMLDGTGIKNKLLEGLACGAPVVATRLSCQGTKVQSGKHVLLGEDAPELAAAVSALLEDRALAVSLGTAGREYVRQHHLWEAVAAQYESEYRFVMRSSGSEASGPPPAIPIAKEQALLHELVLHDHTTASRVPQVHLLSQDVEWSTFERLALDLRLLPLAMNRIERYPDAGVPDALRKAALSMTLIYAERGTLSELLQLFFVKRCNDQGIAAVTLKGPELARRIHGDPGLRPSADLDVLVRLSDLADAGAIAEELGYEYVPELLDRGGRPLLHRAYTHPGGALPPLEIHWRIHWYESQFAEDALTRAVTVSGRLHLLPEDELLALLLFFTRDGLQGLRYQADIIAWWRHYESHVNVLELRRRYRTYPKLKRAVEAAARVLAEQTELDLTQTLGIVADSYRAQLAVNTSSIQPARTAAEGSARAAVVDALVAPALQLPAVLLRRVVAPQATFEARFPSLRQALTGMPHALTRLLGQLKILVQARSASRAPKRR